MWEGPACVSQGISSHREEKMWLFSCSGSPCLVGAWASPLADQVSQAPPQSLRPHREGRACALSHKAGTGLDLTKVLGATTGRGLGRSAREGVRLASGSS